MPKVGQPTPQQQQELDALAAQIKSEVAEGTACRQRGLMHYHRVGGLLIKARAIVGHGKIMAWTEAAAGVKRTQADRYMKFAELPVTGNLEDEWRKICNGHKKQTTPKPKDAAIAALYVADTEKADLPKFNELVERLRAELKAPSPFAAVFQLLSRHCRPVEVAA